MMINHHVASALQQIETVRTDCQTLLSDIKAYSPPDQNGHYPKIFRLIATPMLYSAWERCFTLCHAIALRLIRDVTSTAGTLSAKQRCVWLLKTPFYQSLVANLRKDAASEKAKKGEFSILCDFLPKLDEWLSAGLDQSIDTDNLVMTFSNVNPDVVELNARSIGLYELQQFKELKLGRLHDLVGQRNNIGHGAIIEPPSNDDFTTLLNFTETLVNDYCNVFIAWMQTQSARVPNKRKLPKRQGRGRKITKISRHGD